MRFIFSLVFMHVGIMNEASRKLIQKVYSPSQVQEASHLELTNLSFNYLSLQHGSPVIWKKPAKELVSF